MLEMLINNLPKKKWFFVLHTMFKKKKKKIKSQKDYTINNTQTNKQTHFFLI